MGGFIRDGSHWEEIFRSALEEAGLYYVHHTNVEEPDFFIEAENARVAVECTAVTPGESGLPDSVPLEPIGRSGWRDGHPAQLRLAQRIEEKSEQYERFLSRAKICATDLYCVAIDVSQLCLRFSMSDAMTVLFGIGNDTAVIDRESGKIIRVETEVVSARSKRSSGSPVEMGYFSKNKTNIDAVAICNFSRPSGHEFFGSTIFPNPYRLFTKNFSAFKSLPFQHSLVIERTSDSFRLEYGSLARLDEFARKP